MYNKYIIIGGDFNVDMLDKKNKQSEELLNVMRSFNLEQIIKEPTRVTKTTSTCIDLIFTNYKPAKHKPYVEDHGLSDHKSVNTIINTKEDNKNQIWLIEKRIFSNQKIKALKDSLLEINWDAIIKNDDNANESYDSFQAVINKHLNDHIPKQIIKLQKVPKKGWLTNGLKKSCLHKRALKIILNETKSEVIEKYYSTYSKILKLCVKISKRKDYIKQMINSDNKVITMWKIINNKTGKTKNKKINNIKLEINNKIEECPTKIANKFNEYFLSIGDI